MEATMEVDRETRMAYLEEVKIPNLKFPSIEDQENIEMLRDFLELSMSKWDLDYSVDEIISSIELSENEQKKYDNFQHTPPEIIVSYEPAMVVIIDGDPKLKDLEGTNYQSVINTPFFILYNKKSMTYYLVGDEKWYQSPSMGDDWTHEETPPKDALEIFEKVKADTEESGEEAEDSGVIPKILVRTKPSEILVFDGEPAYAPIQETNLLFATNTTSHVFIDINSQETFIVLSGRWYKASSLNGPWNYIESAALPEDFGEIPVGSDKDAVLAHVAGTDAAREAVLDAQVPQTA